MATRGRGQQRWCQFALRKGCFWMRRDETVKSVSVVSHPPYAHMINTFMLDDG